ncbi:MAG: helix-hairpin-helix domain-containing protein [Brevundimonas sp.]|uniref:helix-hairpin-helix domain-containing protein n=1 Tax=Brevundimonas sp. TaxID=1871086 RepID=UPI004033686D
MTIVFLVAMTALYSLTSEAASARARVRFLQRALTAEATLSYMVATEPASMSGLTLGGQRFSDVGDEGGGLAGGDQGDGTVRFDGRDYLMNENGPLVVAVQDQAGLVNLAHLTPRQADRLASRLGAPGALARWIEPRFLDYADPDLERRLGGAEAGDYPVGAAPANRELRRTDEWLSILGVREAVKPARWREMRASLALDHTISRINANTASASALEVLFGLNRSQAEAVIRRRNQTPIANLQDLIAVAGAFGIEDSEVVYTFPADRSTITIRDGLSSWVYRANIVLTPSGLERPLWIEQSDMLEAPRRQAAETKNVPRLPYTPR